MDTFAPGPDAQEATRVATARLGAWVADLTWDDLPEAVQQRLQLVLLDSLGVGLVGARLPEQRALVAAWQPGPGPSPVLGAGLLTTVESAAWLNAGALVCLELDEGNKYAKGHPAAHGLPAVLALAASLGASGADTMTALLAAYEVAARFGRASRLRPGAHPHGSWGVAGAAAGCARLLGLDADATAAAIDTGTGMPIAGHFSSALDGNPVRNAWISAANLSGLAAARAARAGVARNTGTAAGSLGDLLGAFDAEALVDDLGGRWDVELGYFKRHASCSFTHPAADAVLELRDKLRDDVHEIRAIEVETHALAVGLDRTSWSERLAAMFSTPFVVAAALVHGHVDPSVSDKEARDDPAVRDLAAKVTMRQAADLDARLPHERAARVRVQMPAATFVAETPNPVGDSAYHPLSYDDVVALLRRLLCDSSTVTVVEEVVDAMPAADDVTAPLQRLAGV
jgi:2-methylcitrate dehydratase PrpD